MFISREQIEYSLDYQFRISNRRDITYYAFDDHIARIVAFGHKREMMKRASNNRSIAQTFTWRLRRSAVTDKKLYGAWKAMKTYARWINAVGNGSNVVKHCSLAEDWRNVDLRVTIPTWRHRVEILARSRNSHLLDPRVDSWNSDICISDLERAHERYSTPILPGDSFLALMRDVPRRLWSIFGNVMRELSFASSFTARHKFKRAAGSQRSTVIFMIRAFRNWQLTVRSNSSNKK